MEYKVRKGIYLKDKNNTYNMIYTMLITTIPFIILSTIYNGIYPVINGEGSLYTVFKPLIFVVVSSLTNILTEYLYYLLKQKKKSINYLLTESFAIIPGVLLSIITPLNTPLYILILGSFISSIYKLLVGGFAKNKLNTTLIGYLVIFIYNYNNYTLIVGPYEIITNILSVGVLIYLIIKENIKYRIPLYSILTILILSLILNINIYNLLSGYILFQLILIAPDNITSPLSHRGQLVGGILLGIISFLLINITNINETIFLAILVFNMLTMIINYITIKVYSSNL